MRHASFNPANGQCVVHFSEDGAGRLEQVLDRADRTFRDDWQCRPVDERAHLLHRAALMLRARRAHLAHLATVEMGKLAHEALAEVDWAAEIFEEHAREAMVADTTGVAHRLTLGGRAVPVGVVLCVESWNLPYYLAARIAAPNLIAGNTVLMKHSERVPLCALEFARVLSLAGLPEGAFTTVFLSERHAIAAILDSRVGALALSGEARGLAVYAAASGKPVQETTLEPGGNDIFAVLEDADLDRSVAMAVEARLRNCGQMCTGAKRFLVRGEVLDEFSQRVAHAFRSLVPGDPADPRTTLGPLGHEENLVRALRLVRAATAAGATVETGGRRLEGPGSYIEPTLLTGITPANRVFSQDFIAPVAMVVRVDSDEEIVAIANRSSDMRGAVIMTHDTGRAKAIAGRIGRGRIFINATVVSAFSGQRQPGLGIDERGLSDLPVRGFVARHSVHLA